MSFELRAVSYELLAARKNSKVCLICQPKLTGMRNFKELKIWQKGFEIAVDTYKITEGFLATERYSLVQQLTRAAVSIPSNVAEGSSRRSEKDYGRFIEISLGSSFELETQLLIAKALHFEDESKLQNVLYKLDEEQKMLMAFANKLQ